MPDKYGRGSGTEQPCVTCGKAVTWESNRRYSRDWYCDRECWRKRPTSINYHDHAVYQRAYARGYAARFQAIERLVRQWRDEADGLFPQNATPDKSDGKWIRAAGLRRCAQILDEVRLYGEPRS